MNDFADLIPASRSGEFDDLIPEQKAPISQTEGLINALKRGLKTTAAIPDVIKLSSLGGNKPSIQYAAMRGAQLEGSTPGEYLERVRQPAVERVAKRFSEINQIPLSEAQRRMADAKTWQDRFGAWIKDPVELTASIVLESLPPSLAGAAVGAVGGPAGMMAGVGLSSGVSTFASELLGNAAQRGVDITNPKSLNDWLNSGGFDDDYDAASTKAGFIGAIDAATAGEAGSFLRPALKTGLRNVIKGSAKEVALQAAGGAGGEAGGSLLANQPIDPFNVFAEAIAEVGSAPGEVVGNIREELGSQRQQRITRDVQDLRSRIATALEEASVSRERPVQPEKPTNPPSAGAEQGGPPADIPQQLEKPIELKPLPQGTRITVQPSEEFEGETMPGYIQVDFVDEQGNNTRSTNPEQLAKEGYLVPDISNLGKGRYTLTENGFEPIPPRTAQPSTVEAPAPSTPTPQEKSNDTKDTQGLRPLQQENGPTPVQTGQQEGGTETGAPGPVLENAPGLTPTGPLGIISLNQPKVEVELQYDPGIIVSGGKKKQKARQAGKIPGWISLGSKFNKGWLLIQYRTSESAAPRTVWRANLEELKKAGIFNGSQVNLDALYASPLLQKVEDKTGNFKAIKLPTEQLERAEGAGIDGVLAAGDKINPFFGAILRALNAQGLLTIEKARELAGAKTGGAEYAAKGSDALATQLHQYLRRVLGEIMEEARGGNDASTFRALQSIYQRIQADSPKFNEQDVHEAAARIGSEREVNTLAEDRNVIPFDARTDEASGAGDEGRSGGIENTVGQWDAARLDGVVGNIEEIDPKLYASFNAEPEDDAAWAKIEAGLKKLFADRNIGTPEMAEELANTIRENRANGTLYNPGEVSRLNTIRHTVAKSGTAKGKEGLLKLFSDRSIPMNPKMRDVALALLKRIPAKYLDELTVRLHADGGLQGEFINVLNTAMVAVNAKDPQTAAHEMAHYLATFLNQKDRSRIGQFRREAIERLKNAGGDQGFFQWLDGLGGTATSSQYMNRAGMNFNNDPLYHLVNDDEYFAQQFTQAASRLQPEELKTLVSKIRELIRHMLDALKSVFGDREAYFNNIIRRFERGDISVDAQGGLLYERNRNPKMQGLISTPKRLERFENIESGQDEREMIRGLAIEQNEPLVGHIYEAFNRLKSSVQAKLPFIRERIQVLQKALANGRVQSNSPISTYATILNGLELEQQARKNSSQLDSLVEKLSGKQEELPKISEKEAEAKALHETVQGIIRDYKDALMSKAREDEAKGLATGLDRAIKYLDSLQSSTAALERVVQFMAERLSVDELNNPLLSANDVLELFKQKLSADNAGRPWQEATIPAKGGMPGVSNEHLLIALKIMQQRQELANDLLDIRELHDAGLRQFIHDHENQFDEEIKSLTRNSLPKFLREYFDAKTEESRARAVYLKHRRQVKSLLDQIQDRYAAEQFLQSEVFESSQYKAAMDQARHAGFMDASIVQDKAGNILRRNYYNPANPQERVTVEDGFTKEVYERNIENLKKVAGWLEDYLRTGTDPLMLARAEFELHRIYDYELNPAWSPEAGKLAPGPWNPLNWVSNLIGGSSQFVLNRIGGRAAMQTAHLHSLYDDVKREATDARHNLRWPKTKRVLEAAKAHGVPVQLWRDEVADPILQSFNSLGAKQAKVGDVLWTGRRVKQEDIAALRAQKSFVDGLTDAAFKVKTKLGEFFPVKTLENVFGREYYRPQQGHSSLIMPRRFSDRMYEAIRLWHQVMAGKTRKDSFPELQRLVSSGPLFDLLVLGHIRSMQLYPDYSNSSRFAKAYKEIWKQMREGNAPSSLNEVVDRVFDAQAGEDASAQLSKEEIAKEIVLGEVGNIIKKASDSPEYEIADLKPGATVDVMSGNNFLNKPREGMVVPDAGYTYSIVENNDENWIMRNVLEVNLQRYRDGLGKVKEALEAELAKFRNEAEAKRSRQDQVSGNQWLDYEEAKTLLRQVNMLLDRSSPQTFNLFIDQYNRGIFRHLWSLVQQSLLGAVPVMWRNFMGGSMRLAHVDALIHGNGFAMGIPRWLLKLPVTMGRAGIMPLVDTAGLIKKHFDYNRAKGIVGEDALRIIRNHPELINQWSSMVAADTLRNAAIYQDALDLGIIGSYGLKNQIQQYAELFGSGGELRQGEQGKLDKLRGGIISTIGLAQEAGIGPLLFPRAIAPRKIEQIINFAAMMRAGREIEQLQINLLKSMRNREAMGHPVDKLSAAEIMGNPKATERDVAYFRNLFNRAGINLDYAAKRFLNESRKNPEAQLLTDTERRSFYLAFAKEVNMAGSDNRVRFKSEASQVLSSLMGYGFYQNEAFINALSRFSRDPRNQRALANALMLAGVTTLMAVGFSQPWQRVMRSLLYKEEDPAGKFSSDNTAWRNAAIWWEQTAPFWPITGSLISQLYDVRQGGNKFFNFLPINVLSSIVQAANETAATGNPVQPLIRLVKQWVPNSKLILNRLPGQEGLVEVANATRIFRGVNDGTVEVKPITGQTMKPSPISPEIRMAVNELVKASPDWSVINAVREQAVGTLVKAGASRQDAEKRFDSSVLARTPQNSVYGRALTQDERDRQLARMSPTQRAIVDTVEGAFNRYAEHYGHKPKPVVAKTKAITGSSRQSRRTTMGSRPRLTRSGSISTASRGPKLPRLHRTRTGRLTRNRI